ncbi:hypothetical protein [Natrinema pallidum]|uniref:Uncharacterized protein n=1 Tax=Natrinema pallidum TaxID=69527 RepID=A0A4P9TK57_9EURY|nr:hypothetical protein [Natrinema pallidum]QCW05313.1 hypothetical protein FGF80_18915 [Natrinema pallidum]
MTDRYTKLFGEAAEEYDSAEGAWEATKASRQQVDWDPDVVQVGESAGSAFEFETVASDD